MLTIDKYIDLFFFVTPEAEQRLNIRLTGQIQVLKGKGKGKDKGKGKGKEEAEEEPPMAEEAEEEVEAEAGSSSSSISSSRPEEETSHKNRISRKRMADGLEQHWYSYWAPIWL